MKQELKSASVEGNDSTDFNQVTDFTQVASCAIDENQQGPQLRPLDVDSSPLYRQNKSLLRRLFNLR